MKLDEIANRIAAHLARFEKDKTINKPFGTGVKPYYFSHAYRGGRYVRVIYVTYHEADSLTREEALAYLAWLDAGNVGKHWKVRREAAK